MLTIVGAIIALVAVVSAAFVTRAATRDNALLQAQQRTRDVELRTLDKYGQSVISAATEISSYAFNEELRHMEWASVSPHFNKAFRALWESNYLAESLKWDDLSAAHKDWTRDHDRVLNAAGKGKLPAEQWEPLVVYREVMDHAPTSAVSRQLQAVARRRRELLRDYPTELETSFFGRRRKAPRPIEPAAAPASNNRPRARRGR